jgi:hypothetical protein
MKSSNPVLPLATLFAALLLGGAARSENLPAALPDPELLEFLGELSGEEPFFLQYTTTREAKRAARDAEQTAAGPARAGDAGVDPVAWEALDAPAQALLAGQAESWAALPPGRRRAMADGAARWLALDGIGRAQANDRWQTWRSLSDDERDRLRRAWADFRALTPEQQQAVRTAFLRFSDLPEEQRNSLLERWQRMSPEERRRALNRRQGPKPGTEDKRPCPPC